MALGVNATKSPARPSHEALEESGEESAESRLDKVAMEGAKRAGNRIEADETRIPGNSIFTK